MGDLMACVIECKGDFGKGGCREEKGTHKGIDCNRIIFHFNISSNCMKSGSYLEKSHHQKLT